MRPHGKGEGVVGGGGRLDLALTKPLSPPGRGWVRGMRGRMLRDARPPHPALRATLSRLRERDIKASPACGRGTSRFVPRMDAVAPPHPSSPRGERGNGVWDGAGRLGFLADRCSGRAGGIGIIPYVRPEFPMLADGRFSSLFTVSVRRAATGVVERMEQLNSAPKSVSQRFKRSIRAHARPRSPVEKGADDRFPALFTVSVRHAATVPAERMEQRNSAPKTVSQCFKRSIRPPVRPLFPAEKGAGGRWSELVFAQRHHGVAGAADGGQQGGEGARICSA